MAMDDSPDENDSIGDNGDDGQLTIRIPNPKVYMARQSLWIGRRGKPRCDHCRLNNLKCDRVLPACNHCSWAPDRECKYTPLPTPAHRGIPRCDRCRLKNLKCDRNLPICNHCTEENETECNYTPKKRPKAQAEPPPKPDPRPKAEASPILPETQEPGPSGENNTGHTFYGQNVASGPTSGRKSPQTGRFTADPAKDSRKAPLTLIAPKPLPSSSAAGVYIPTYDLEQSVILNNSHIEPWTHSSFASLPDYIVQRLRLTSSVEVPNRTAFNDALSTFLDGLVPSLREVASLDPDTYAAVCHAISKGDFSSITERIRAWTGFHHLRLGSNNHHLLVIPKDFLFDAQAADEDKLLTAYRSLVDERAKALPYQYSPTDEPMETTDPAAAFERLPVRTQIYDVLTYAHRAHEPSFTMFSEIRRLGIATITWPMVEMYVRLCPLCNLRAKQETSHSKSDRHL
ncbi:hypothetical protein BDN72DRAFT_885766 [Pluteus cervinus]|uniref:Uncharacterized protein n=1 Tax=Pluteus cervinus TaxID=181527 RepID=A0ACD3BBI3_9AGAR|nr:hypothetical protein BDN72DRAFT_885766 [Pluteus cervinus]